MDKKHTTVIANGYKILIQEILDNEFDDSHSSLPSPNFTTLHKIQNEKDKNPLFVKYKKYDKLTLNIIDNPVEFSKFGSEILKMAIDNKIDSTVQKIFDKVLDITNNTMSIISLHLP